MSSSRRNFLALAGAGAAGAGLSSAVGFLGSEALSLGGSPSIAPPKLPAGLTGSVVAYIDDVNGDEVSLMIGETEVVLKDSTLVARIASAATSAQSSTVV